MKIVNKWPSNTNLWVEGNHHINIPTGNSSWKNVFIRLLLGHQKLRVNSVPRRMSLPLTCIFCWLDKESPDNRAYWQFRRRAMGCGGGAGIGYLVMALGWGCPEGCTRRLLVAPWSAEPEFGSTPCGKLWYSQALPPEIQGTQHGGPWAATNPRSGIGALITSM